MKNKFSAGFIGEQASDKIEQVASSEETNERKGKRIILYILVALFIVAAGVSVFLYKQLRGLKNDPKKIAEQEVLETVKEVGKIMVLPDGEQPTLALVADPEKLKDQPFFAKAKKGDKVLLYGNARKAILYDPMIHKIVEVAPINFGNPPSVK